MPVVKSNLSNPPVNKKKIADKRKESDAVKPQKKGKK